MAGSARLNHDEPYGLGGDRSADNIRLMCSCHNAYMAELDYGKEKMDPYRRSADRVREPQPSFDYSRFTPTDAVLYSLLPWTSA